MFKNPTPKFLIFSLIVFSIFILASHARAGVPEVVSAKITGSTQLTIVYSEDVITDITNYANLNFSSTGPASIILVGGSGTNTIAVNFDIILYDTSETGTIDIAGVTSLGTGDFLIPVFDQVLADGRGPNYVTACPVGSINSTFNINLYFSESVVGFDIDDILTINNTVTNFTVLSLQSYSMSINANAEGPAAWGVGATTDLIGNSTPPGSLCSYTYDITPPTVVISSTELNPTSTNPIPLTLTFSEDVTGVSLGQFLTNNIGLLSNLAGGPAVYTFDAFPSTEGLVSIGFVPVVTFDLAGNPSTVSNSFSISYDDGKLPTILSAGVIGDTTLKIKMSEPVTIVGSPDWAIDVVAPGLTAINGSMSNPTISSTLYITILPLGDTSFSTFGLFVTPGILTDIIGGDTNPPYACCTGGFINDWQSPTVITLGDGVTTYYIEPSAATTLTFSEPLSVASKNIIETALTTEASQTVSFSWDITNSIMTLFGPPGIPTNPPAVFVNDVYVIVQDANLNTDGLLLIKSAGDNTSPVITMLGGNVNLTQGDSYNDAGATALDNIDGDITSSVVINNPVNTNVTGTYNVTYNINDTAGNVATQVNRTVIVNPPASPIVSGGGGGGSVILLDACENIPDMQSDSLSTYIFYNNECLTPEEYKLAINPKSVEPVNNSVEKTSETIVKLKNIISDEIENSETNSTSISLIESVSENSIIKEQKEKIGEEVSQKIETSSQLAAVGQVGILEDKTFFENLFQSISNFFKRIF